MKNLEIKKNQNESITDLINVVEKSEYINSDSFDCIECFIEIDNKIDFFKENLELEFLDKLEKLDKLNYINLSISFSAHKKYISEIINKEHKEVTNEADKKLSIAIPLSIVGLTPYYYKKSVLRKLFHLLFIILGIMLIYLGYETILYPTLNNGNLPISNSIQIEKVRNVGAFILGLGIFFYILQFIMSLKIIISERKNHLTNILTIDTLKTYANGLNKIKLD